MEGGNRGRRQGGDKEEERSVRLAGQPLCSRSWASDLTQGHNARVPGLGCSRRSNPMWSLAQARLCVL